MTEKCKETEHICGRSREIGPDSVLLVSDTGDFLFLSPETHAKAYTAPAQLSLQVRAELQSKFLLACPSNSGFSWLRASRIATRRETINDGPSLHIFVPTLLCEHTCRYCQVSRSLGGEGFTMSEKHLDAAVETAFQSTSRTLTIEFQGGDPLLRYDLVRRAIERATDRNREEGRALRFVVASTLHQLTREMCAFFKEYNVYLSTSIDGPALLHNKNRPLRGGKAYEQTVRGIDIARSFVGEQSVSAIATVTRASLDYPTQIVDEYVRLGFEEIFVRPVSPYGFARKRFGKLGVPPQTFLQFYEKAFDRVLIWNRNRGVPIKEVTASILFNKMLCTFDAGYVDLQSPTGAGSAVLVYNYDGYVYPSDEARMIAEQGDTSLRMGRIGDTLESLCNSAVARSLKEHSKVDETLGCWDCAYRTYCGPDPIDTYGHHGKFRVPVHDTDHCKRYLSLFDCLFRKLRNADEWFLDLAYEWAQPPRTENPRNAINTSNS